MQNGEDSARERILAARAPHELFGDAADRAALRRAYRGLARAVHPDTAAGDCTAFTRLAALYARAERQLARGTYGAAVVVEGRRHRYRLAGELARGDSSTVFRARYDGPEGEPERGAIVKLVRDARDNELAAGEAATLVQLLGNVDTYDVLSPYLPAYIESFGIAAPAAPQPRRALAFAAPHPNLVSLAAIRARRPGGLPAQDAAWILRRILVALGLVHANGILHGALTPDHVLVEPSQRGIVIVDWKYAVQDGGIVPALPADWRAMVAPEVAAVRPAGPATDIFMAMRCVAYVLGGDPATGALPRGANRRVAGFLRGASHPNPRRRPADALALKEELDELTDRLWGPRRFAPLEI